MEAGEEVLAALEGFSEVAPAHNPAYAAGIRQFGKILPEARRVALFETAYYQWVPFVLFLQVTIILVFSK